MDNDVDKNRGCGTFVLIVIAIIALMVCCNN